MTGKNKRYYDNTFDGGNEPYGADKRRKDARYKEKTTKAYWFTIFIHEANLLLQYTQIFPLGDRVDRLKK